MTSVISISATVFLFSAVTGILAMLVAGIRSDDRARNLTSDPRTRAEKLTRRLLGVGVRDHQNRTGEPR